LGELGQYSTGCRLVKWDLIALGQIMYYSGINIFSNLPYDIKDLANKIILFRNALRRFLLINSFYNSEEYFNYQR
jgi:hypothetical protein